MATLSTKFKLIDDMSSKLKEISTSGQEVKQNLTDIGTSSSSLDKITTSAETSTNAINESSEVIQEYIDWHEKSLDALTNYINGVEGSEEELKKYTQGTDSASESTEEFDDKLKKTQEEHEKTQEQTEKTSQKTKEYEETTTTAMNNIENIIASAGIVMFLKKVADGYMECVTASSQYESSLAKVSTIADTSVLSIDSIGNEISSLSQETGQSVNDLSEATYQAISAGVDTANSVDFVNQANKLAVGGFTDTTTAVDVLTTSLNAYNLKTSDTQKVSDYLIETQNLGKTTVDELSSSMGRVIPSAAAYNVQMSDLCTSYAILTANGIATAEATTYLKGMMNELGDSSSDVSTVLQEQTGQSFAQLISSGNSLGDVIGILASSVDNDATAFSNLWSSQEAGVGALSLLTTGTEKYNSTLATMTSATGTAEEAYDKMTSTSEYTSKAMQNAAENFKIAVGNTMLPATNGFNKAITDVLNNLTSFVTAHPGVVKAVAALTAGLGVATGAIVAYTAVTKLATLATAAFTAMSGPIGAIVTILGAVTVGVSAWAMAQEDASKAGEDLCSTSKLQYENLEQLKSQYKELCDAGKENETEAVELKYQINDLSESFEENKQTVDEFNSSYSKYADEYKQLHDNYSSSMQDIDNEADSTSNLIDRLQELGSKSVRTADEQSEMVSIIDILNQKMPTLGLTYSSVSDDIQGTIDKLKALSSVDIATEKYETAKDTYEKAEKLLPGLLSETKAKVDEVSAAQTILEEKTTNLATAQEEYNSVLEKYGGDDQSGKVSEAAQKLNDAEYELSEATTARNDAINESIDANNEYNSCLSDSQNAFEEYKDAFIEMNGFTVDSSNESQEAITSAAMSVNDELQKLAEAYDEAYNSALASFEGQYNLWDYVDGISKISAETLNENLDSQITYWTNYSDNLESLQKRNIKGLDELVASMDNGSEDSAAALAGMATATDGELQKMVDKYGTLKEEQGKSATSVAELELDFKDKMDKMAKDAENAIDGMNLSAEASKSAKSTIDEYIAGIRAGIGPAGDAMAEVVANVKSKLGITTTSGSSSTSSSSTVPKKGYAKGTDYAEEDIFIAGEEGPELIVGQKGAKVYTAEETRNILNTDINIPDISSSNAGTSKTEISSAVGSGGDKVITLRLEGVGDIQIAGKNSGASKAEIVDILAENLKPVLISVLNEEIYEEADDSYEF